MWGFLYVTLHCRPWSLPACLLVFVFSWSIMSQPSLSHFRLQPLHMLHGRSSQAPPRLNKRSSSERETRIATRHCLCAYQARSCNIKWSEQCFGLINFHRDPSMYTAYGPRGLYWNPASPVKLTWSELDRSNFACARSAVTSLVPLERKETQPFFSTSLKNTTVKVCGYTRSAKFFRPFGENCSVFWGRQGEMTHGHEGSFSTFLWRFLHVMNKGIKSGMMRPSN